MNKKGFTLLELLVVVLIIGILAGIALPQYQMAVTKAKVASILPIMRRWKDALAEYKLQHGYYCDNGSCPNGGTLGVNWPSDWRGGKNKPCQDRASCGNDYWNNCTASSIVHCDHCIDADNCFSIVMYQADDPEEDLAGNMTCEPYGTEAEKVCKALGGHYLEDVNSSYMDADSVYKLN